MVRVTNETSHLSIEGTTSFMTPAFKVLTGLLEMNLIQSFAYFLLEKSRRSG